MLSPSPNVYLADNAHALCEASADAYLGRESDADAVVQCLITDTVVTLTKAGDYVVMAFRGTKDLRNWLTDLDCHLVEDGGLRVHAGFCEAWKSVAEDVVKTIETLQPGANQLFMKRLFITGHSLGGALAQLAAFDLAVKYGRSALAGVYTFGQPRVGDPGFARAYNNLIGDRTFRVVHDVDIVPHVPWLLGTRRHTEREIYYDGAGICHERAPRLWRVEMQLLATWHGLAQRRAVNLDDHHIDTYLALFK